MVAFGFSRILVAAALPFGMSVALAASPASALHPGALAEAALGTLPGVASVGVLRDGRMEVAVRRREGPGGPVTSVRAEGGTEPVFEIGSVSKVFTGLLVAQAVERNEVSLDDPLGKLLAGRVPFRWEQAQNVTVRQLLTHTGCLPRWPSTGSREPQAKQLAQYDRERLWSDLGNLLIARTPPCESRYSNFGYAILGELLAERAGSTWEALVRDAITARAAMTSTAVTVPPNLQSRLAPPFSNAARADHWRMNAFSPAGGLHASASDLLRFSQALLQGRNGPFGLAAERAVSGLAGHGEKSDRIGYGVILPAAGPSRTWAHNGLTGGYRAEWIVWPEHAEAVVILVSNSAAPSHDIARQVLRQTWAGAAEKVVYSQGEFRATSIQQGRHYAHIKLAPGRKIPFSTLTYRVFDAGLLANIQPGTLVEFRAGRVDGENVILDIRHPQR